MGTKVASLSGGGDLKALGVFTELPTNKDNLKFAISNSMKGVAYKNLIDYRVWAVGTSGSQGIFGQNGDGNSIILDKDPFGKLTPVWQTLNNDVESGADGGWATSTFPIDNSKMYRFSTWIRRNTLGNGSFYFGLNGYGSVSGVVANNGSTTLNTNPYFRSGGWYFPLNEWVLLVAHVWEHDNTEYITHPDTGTYDLSGNKISTCVDYKWIPETTSARHRTYLYYSTAPETHQLWCYPRVDLIDGTEPSISDLLNGEGNVFNPLGVRYIRDYLNGSTTDIYNHWVEIQAITYSGENVALGKSSSDNLGGSRPMLTDGNMVSHFDTSNGLDWVQVDLGHLYKLEEIKVWHYYGDGRTYYSTKTEVSADGILWYTIFDSAQEGTYPETPAGKTHRLEIKDVEYSREGIIVDEATENLLYDNGVINWTIGSQGTCTTLIENSRYKILGSSTGGTMRFYIPVSKLVGGYTYTMSFKMKFISEGTFYMNDWCDTVFSKSGVKEFDDYLFCYATGSRSSHDNTYRFMDFTIGANVHVEIWDVQFERKDYPTAFVAGKRASTGSLKLPVNLGLGDATVYFKGIAMKNSDNRPVQLAMFTLVDNSGTDILFRSYTTVPYLNGNDFDGGSHNVHKDFNTESGVPFEGFITRSGNTVTLKLHSQDGQQVTWQLPVDPATDFGATSFKFDSIELSGDWGGIIKEVSVYDVVKDDFPKSSFSPDKSGDVFVEEMYESENLLGSKYMGKDFFNDGVFGGASGDLGGISYYTQPQCKVFAVKASRFFDKYSVCIKRTPNLIYPDVGTVMWGGLRLYPPEAAKQEGKTYKITYWCKGQSTMTCKHYFAYEIGWSSMGVGLTNHGLIGNIERLEAGTIQDEWVQKTNYYTVSNRFQLGSDGTTYDTYYQMKIGYNYGSTGSLGTTLFISDLVIEEIDISDVKKAMRLGKNSLKLSTFIEGINKVVVIGGAQAAGDVAVLPRLVKFNDVTLLNATGRGLYLTVFENDGTLVSNTLYDTYGVDQARTDLANALLNVGSFWWALTSYDACKSNATLDQVMTDLGSIDFVEYNWDSYYRSPYACIGFGNRLIKEEVRSYGDDRFYATINYDL